MVTRARNGQSVEEAVQTRRQKGGPRLRFESKSRLGFYPPPLSEAQRIRRFLLFPNQPSSATDPCGLSKRADPF